MIVAAALWLVLCVGFAVSAPRLTTSARPDVAVRLTVCAAVAQTGAGVFVLGSAAATWAAQQPLVATLIRLSAGKLHAASPIPSPIAVLAAAALVTAAGSLTIRAWRSAASHHAVRAAVGRAGDDEVVVLDDERIDAFATAGRRGRIVVTTGLLAALEPAEQEALFAHERAHRRHGHAWWRLAMQLTVAVNPLLRRVSRAVDHAMERSADEDAAAQVGDRRLVARTIARVSLLRKHAAATAIGLAVPAGGGDIPARVHALLKPASPRSRLAAIALLVFLTGALVAAVLMQRTTDSLFDSVQVG